MNSFITTELKRYNFLLNEILGSWSKQEWTEYIDLTQRFLNALKSKVKELSL